MPNEDLVVKDEAQELRDKNRTLEEQILNTKTTILRLWARNRYLQQRLGAIENRVKLVAWLALALLGGSVGTLVLIAKGQTAHLQNQLARLQETVTPLQERIAGFDHTARSEEGRVKDFVESGTARIKQAETDIVESMKTTAPEILAAVLRNAVHIDSAGNVGVGILTPAAKLHVVGNLLGAARGSANEAFRIVVGKTDPKKTAWVQYTDSGIYVDVDTSSAGFSSTPQYFTSLGGHTNNWLAQGATSIYRPTAQGFRIHVSYQDLTAAKAKKWGWYINWIAVGG